MRTKIYLILALSLTSSVGAQTPAERKPLPKQEMRALAATYDLLLTSYVTPLAGSDLIKAAIQGMLREIDPEGGEYWTEQEFQEFRAGPPPGTGSIGTELRRRDGVLIFSPIADGPASLAGIKFGDELRAVEGVPVGSSTVTRVLGLLSGPVGSSVSLSVFRRTEGTTRESIVKRALIPNPAPTFAVLPQGLAILRVSSLSPTQVGDAFALLRDAWTSSQFQGLILDLRNNGGGLVESAVALAAAFLPKDAIVATMAARTEGGSRVFRAVPTDYSRGASRDPDTTLPREMRKVPLVLLVDSQTASGAEIVVAALRDAGRASVVGRPTLGRGSVQTVTPISGAGAVKYTTAQWFSPSGARIERSPIVPSRLVEETSNEADVAAAAAELHSLVAKSQQ
jgi:carboxyl-terminal processing protease